MNNTPDLHDELRPEYDMKTLLKGAVRGKYAQRYAEGTNLVLLDPDTAKGFFRARAVRQPSAPSCVQLSRIPQRPRTPSAHNP
ncbi:MAG: hypothetical protein IPL28_09335 [Chloroflexi bacterium]|nr:hypothetical protein [Chloroflexota bacterium]